MEPTADQQRPWWKRSAVLYAVVAAVLAVMVNWRMLEEQYTAYLFWRYRAEQFQDNLIGAAYLETLTRLHPQDADAFAQLGICYYRMGREKEAVAAYLKAVALNPAKYSVNTAF